MVANGNIGGEDFELAVQEMDENLEAIVNTLYGDGAPDIDLEDDPLIAKGLKGGEEMERQMREDRGEIQPQEEMVDLGHEAKKLDQ